MLNAKRVRVVFDSGILVSAFVTRRGLAATLLQRCIESAMTAVRLSDEILTETRRVLLERPHLRSRFAYREEDVEDFIESMRQTATLVVPEWSERLVEADPKDDVIVATALTAGANYLVSRDKHLLDIGTFENVTVLTPEAFIARLEGESGAS